MNVEEWGPSGLGAGGKNEETDFSDTVNFYDVTSFGFR